MSEYPTVHDNEISLLKKIATNTGEISDGGGVGGGSGTSADTTYDNSTSGLTSTDVQAAIDEAVVLIEARLESIEASVTDGQVVVFNGSGGKSGKKATGTGVAKLDNGVLGTVTIGSGLDYTGGTLSATGAGTKTIAVFKATDNEPPASNYATYTLRNARPVLGFDATTQWAAVFSGRIPEGADLTGGLTVKVLWAAESATSGTIGWDVALERVVAGGIDLDSDSFGTAQTITAATVSGTSGITSETSVTFTQGQLPASFAAGDAYRVRVRRDVANDTATGQAQIYQVELQLP